MDPAIVLFGLCIGVLVGMTGMGGGSLMTPLLILIFGTSPTTAEERFTGGSLRMTSGRLIATAW